VARFLSVLALLAVLATSALFAEEGPDAEEARHLLAIVRRDDDPAAWKDAVDRLRTAGEEQRQSLSDLLARMAAERLRDLRHANARIDALATALGDGEREAAERKAWDEARHRACAWIFDVKAFPVPADPVITGPRAGYDQAKPRGDEALQTWAELTHRLDRRLHGVTRLSARKADGLAGDDAAAFEAYRRVAAEVPDAEPAPAPDALAVLLLATRRGDLAPVVDAYGRLDDGWPRLCLFRALCIAILEANEHGRFDMERDAVAAIRGINQLRMALGISPVLHDEKLARMAEGHSREMEDLGYFSHRSPTAGRETKEQRAALVGYDAQVVECITGVGGDGAAVAFWRYDGGHHRDMCDPRVVEAGCSTAGPTVYVGGKGDTGHLPGFRYGE
jgi:hypothetical protein